jgi:MFS family permease
MAASLRKYASDRPVRRSILLAAATLSQFGASVTQQGTLVLGVFFAATYRLNLAQMGTLLSALTLGWAASAIVIGKLVDRYGPRRMLGIGTSILSGLAVAIALSNRLALTAALLFALGIVLGTVPLSGTKAVLVIWPREQRGLPMGIRQMGVPVGAMVAALVLPTLAERVGVRPLYFSLALLLAVSGFTFCAVLPPHRATPSTLAPTDHALGPGAARYALPAACGFLLAWGQYALVTYTIPMLRDREGLAISTAGILLALAQAGGAAARMLFGHLSDRLGGQRDRVLLGAAIGAAALAVIVASLPMHLSLVILAPLWLLLGATMVGWNALALTWAGERVAVQHAALAMGTTTSAILLGATVSAPAFGLIVEMSGSYRIAWLVLALVLGCAALLLWLHARRPTEQPRTSTIYYPLLRGAPESLPTDCAERNQP